jgi:hypothetical protein
MHCIYGALRLFALVFDACVFYHAKNLKILEEEESEHEGEDEQEEMPPIPKTEHHLVSLGPDNPKKNSKQHKRSASKEIRLFFDTDGDTVDGNERRSSRQSDYMANTISGITSTDVV